MKSAFSRVYSSEGRNELNYASVCSGIESASQAFEPLGWTPKWFAEIDKDASRVLSYRYPNVRNLGDFTAIPESEGPVDLLVGGTPCQSFSVAGKRAGLDDPRGNLAIEFLRTAHRLHARWLVWENVPGVLSSWSDVPGSESFDGRLKDQTSDLDSFFLCLAELGYGFAYRVVDALYVGGCPLHRDEFRRGPVPQRRRRLFVVAFSGDLGPSRCPRTPQQLRRFSLVSAAALFESASVRGYPAPGATPQEETSSTLGGSTSSGGWGYDLDRGSLIESVDFRNGVVGDVAHTLQGGGNIPAGHRLNTMPGLMTTDTARAINTSNTRQDATVETFVEVSHPVTTRGFPDRGDGLDNLCGVDTFVEAAGSLRAASNGHGGLMDSDRADTLLGVEAFKPSHFTRGKDGKPSSYAPPLSADADKGDQDTVIYDAAATLGQRMRGQDDSLANNLLAFGCKDSTPIAHEEVSPCLRSMSERDSHANAGGQVAIAFEPRFARNGRGAPSVVASPLKAQNGRTGKGDGAMVIAADRRVRRLTVIEAEQLMGMPANWTRVPVRKVKRIDPRKPWQYEQINTVWQQFMADGPRYKMVGNSMVVPVMRWIGTRIDFVDKYIQEHPETLAA